MSTGQGQEQPTTEVLTTPPSTTTQDSHEAEANSNNNISSDTSNGPSNGTDSTPIQHPLRIEIQQATPTDSPSPTTSHQQRRILMPVSALEMQQNFTSLLSQARSEIERHAERTRNVFQGVNAQRVGGNFRAWMPNTARLTPPPHPVTFASHSRPPLSSTSSDSVAINIFPTDNDHPSTHNQHHRLHQHYHDHSYSRQQSAPNIEAHRASIDSSPPRSLQERVAALTRNDPPNLLNVQSRGTNGTGDPENGNADGGGGGRDGGAVALPPGGAVAEVFADYPEVRRFFAAVSRYIPFICILLLKSAYDNMQSLIDIVSLACLFVHINNSLKEQVAKHTQKSLFVLQRGILIAALFIFYRCFFIEKDYFIFLLFTGSGNVPQEIGLGRLLLNLAITDLVSKLVTVSIKMMITMLPPHVINYKRRGRIYFLTEALSQMYRALVPIQMWLEFLFHSYTGIEKIFPGMLSSVYMLSKSYDLFECAKVCKRAFIAIRRKVSYGTCPTKEQLTAAGDLCPICHDNYNTPVYLECGHIFCELCVGTWFTREQTCPLCRAKVVEDLSWHDGSTSYLMYLY